MQERGIVLTHQMDPKKGSFSGQIDPNELRKHLLYWDFVDFPDVILKGPNVKVGQNFNSDEDVKLLTQQGIIRHTKVVIDSVGRPGQITFDEKFMGDVLKGQYKLAEQYNSSNTHCAIAQYNVNLQVPPGFQKEMAAIDVEFINLLPHPSIDTPIVNILEFKRRRSDELSKLRNAMDEFYSSIAININDRRIRDLATRKLSQAIKDVDDTLAEERINMSRLNLGVLIKPSIDFVVGYGLGYEFAKNNQLPELPISLGFGIGNALISGSVKRVMGPKGLSEATRDFAYLYRAKKELKIK